ncbi:MAG: hypothetical protein LBF21_00630 [Puniceicoccales bacterium]|jgi:hypothetical protein|nr:hypothetical protein [Puniceicoccales bacterium]
MLKKNKKSGLNNGKSNGIPFRTVDSGILEDVDFNTLCPVFSLRYMSRKHGLESCTPEEKQAFVGRMILLSKLTWREIIAAPRCGLGSEKIKRSSITKDSIPTEIPPDAKFLALHFYGKARMVGFREKEIFRRDIFHIVWLDRGFTLYDHGA